MENEIYDLLYTTKKNKYLLFNEFQKDIEQHGGVTTKSGIYAIFYKNNQLDKFAMECAEDRMSHDDKKIKKEYISVDKIRNMFAGHGFFYKSEANVVKSVVNPKKLFSLVDKLIKKDKNVEKVIKDSIATKMSKKHKEVGKDTIDKDIATINVSEIMNNPKINSRETVNVSSPLNITKYIIIKKTGKFSKDEKSLDSALKGELQKIANAIYADISIKPNRVDIIKINNVGTNEYIGNVILDDLLSGEEDRFSENNISSDDIKKIAENVASTDGNTLLGATMEDDEEAKSGGFINFDIEYPIVGGGFVSKIAMGFIKMLGWIIAIAVCIVVGAIFIALATTVCILTFLTSCGTSNSSHSSRRTYRGGNIDLNNCVGEFNNVIKQYGEIDSRRKYLKYCGKLNTRINKLYGGEVIPMDLYFL